MLKFMRISKRMILGVVCSIAGSMLSFFVPLLIKDFIDNKKFLMKYTMHRWYFAFDSIELAVKTTLVRCSPISGRMPLELRLMMPLMNRFPLFLFLHIIRYTD